MPWDYSPETPSLVSGWSNPGPNIVRSHTKFRLAPYIFRPFRHGTTFLKPKQKVPPWFCSRWLVFMAKWRIFCPRIKSGATITKKGQKIYGARMKVAMASYTPYMLHWYVISVQAICFKKLMVGTESSLSPFRPKHYDVKIASSLASWPLVARWSWLVDGPRTDCICDKELLRGLNRD